MFLLPTVLVAIPLERKVLGRMHDATAPTGSGRSGLRQSLGRRDQARAEGGPPGASRLSIGRSYLMAPVISVTTAILASR